MANNPTIFKLDFSDNHKLYMPSTAKIQARVDGTYQPITAELTESEFSKYIQQLIRELQQIEIAGKQKFASLAQLP